MERAPENLGKVQHGMRLERAAVLGFRHAEHAPDATRDNHVEISTIAVQHAEHALAVAHNEFAVVLPVALGCEIRLRIGELLPRLPVLGQKMLTDARERGLHGGRIERHLVAAACLEPAQIPGEQRERGLEGTRVEEALKASGGRGKRGAQLTRPSATCLLHREAARPRREEPPQHIGRGCAAIQEERQRGADAALAQLRERERDVLVLPGERAADPKRPIERLVDEARHLGLVRHREPGVQVGFERKLA